jgi:hypothetical protein
MDWILVFLNAYFLFDLTPKFLDIIFKYITLIHNIKALVNLLTHKWWIVL